MLIFTYGTLCRGQRADRLMDRSKYICRAYVNGYTLHDMGAFPIMHPCKEESAQVWGDLWRVQTGKEVPQVAILDQYEGEGYVFNRKRLSVVAVSSMRMEVPAITYISNRLAPLGFSNWGGNAQNFIGVDRRGYERADFLGV